MNREHRYYVAKKKDVEKYLPDEQQLQFDRLLTKIRVGRLNDGKSDVQTVCVDSDWPEYETVWKMIEARVDGKASPASVPEGFKHDIGAERFAVVRGSYWWHVRAGNGTQNIGKFHTELSAKEMALTLLTAFRDGAFMQYQADLAAAPTPPVSEDRWQPIEKGEY